MQQTPEYTALPKQLLRSLLGLGDVGTCSRGSISVSESDHLEDRISCR